MAATARWHAAGRRPDLRTADLEICLQLLAEQPQIVLDEVTWPAEREVQSAASTSAAEERDVSQEGASAASRRYVSGITGGQFHALERLVAALAARGDVMGGGQRRAAVASQAVSLVGQAVCNGMDAVRAILVDMEAQSLVQPAARKDLGEERAIYGARLSGSMLSRFAPSAQQGWRVLH